MSARDRPASWRERMAPVIAEVLAERKGQPEREIRKELRRVWSEALGLGVRGCWPYRVWCSEIRRQLAGHAPGSRDDWRNPPLEPGNLQLPLEDGG